MVFVPVETVENLSPVVQVQLLLDLLVTEYWPPLGKEHTMLRWHPWRGSYFLADYAPACLSHNTLGYLLPQPQYRKRSKRFNYCRIHLKPVKIPALSNFVHFWQQKLQGNFHPKCTKLSMHNHWGGYLNYITQNFWTWQHLNKLNILNWVSIKSNKQ